MNLATLPEATQARQRSRPKVHFGNKKVHLWGQEGAFYGQDGRIESGDTYIHFNPVKHGLVTRVADWQWSTFHRFVREQMYSVD